MSETVLPVFGPCVALLPESQFSLIFPIKASTFDAFQIDELETAARVCLYDMAPEGTEIDAREPVKITWSEQVTEGPMGGGMYLVQMIATLKEAIRA